MCLFIFFIFLNASCVCSSTLFYFLQRKCRSDTFSWTLRESTRTFGIWTKWKQPEKGYLLLLNRSVIAKHKLEKK